MIVFTYNDRNYKFILGYRNSNGEVYTLFNGRGNIHIPGFNIKSLPTIEVEDYIGEDDEGRDCHTNTLYTIIPEQLIHNWYVTMYSRYDYRKGLVLFHCNQAHYDVDTKEIWWNISESCKDYIKDFSIERMRELYGRDLKEG